jgi:hypothetical protein
MAAGISTGLRNAVANSILNGAAGVHFDSGVLEIRSGTRPANADAAPTGSVLVTINLPADAFANAASGAAAKAGTWEDLSADAAGTATWFRLRTTSDGGGSSTTDRRIDGDVAMSGADLNLDNTNIAAGQAVTINTFTVTVPATF